jgi:hypothetical protein
MRAQFEVLMWLSIATVMLCGRLAREISSSALDVQVEHRLALWMNPKSTEVFILKASVFNPRACAELPSVLVSGPWISKPSYRHVSHSLCISLSIHFSTTCRI